MNDDHPSITSLDQRQIAPCQTACPLRMDIGSYVDLIAQGRIMEALRIIRDDNPFPSICAYVCTSPCESACRRSQVDKPIAIRALKRFALEYGGDKMIQLEAQTTLSEKIAVVGSGPAGLACAFYLRKIGYPVTVFEAHSELGGMLREGIPKYRLPRRVLDNEIKRLMQMGVEARPNTKVVSLDLLFEMGYQAVFVTVGAHQSLKMGIDGEESPGVLDGASFLYEVNLGLKPHVGERVAVVGGGNSAIDAARSALRLGAKTVTVIYRRSREEMPADPTEVNHAEEEGADFLFLAAPVKIERKEGRLTITCTRMKLGKPDAGGRRRPLPIEGSAFEMQFDTLIAAIGQLPQIPDGFGIHTGRGRTIRVDPLTLSTDRSGVFAGGDAVTGPATVVEALASGRSAAESINDYLQKKKRLTKTEIDIGQMGDLLPKTIEMIRKNRRLEPPILAPEDRRESFGEVELVYDWESAVEEARRCLWCGSGAEITSQDKCATCLTCVRVCPYRVPHLDVAGSIQIPLSQCQACGICTAECPAKVIALRKQSANGEFAVQSGAKPFIVGYYCRYGLYGSGRLAPLWRNLKSGVWVEPVSCVAQIEADRILRAFEIGAEGVLVAGCGQLCAREDTDYWVNQRIEKVKRTLDQLGIEPERVQLVSSSTIEEPEEVLDKFVEGICGFYLDWVIKREVTS